MIERTLIGILEGAVKEMTLHRPYGTQEQLVGHAFPTLKRGANKRCAYGAASGEFFAQLGGTAEAVPFQNLFS